MYLSVTMKRRIIGWTAIVEHDGRRFKRWSTSYNTARSRVREPVIEHEQDRRRRSYPPRAAGRSKTIEDSIFINERTL